MLMGINIINIIIISIISIITIFNNNNINIAAFDIMIIRFPTTFM